MFNLNCSRFVDWNALQARVLEGHPGLVTKNLFLKVGKSPHSWLILLYVYIVVTFVKKEY
jgi:hypothetical protein